MSTISLLSELRNTDVKTVGVNAAFLGELAHNNFITAQGFVIPAEPLGKFVEGGMCMDQLCSAVTQYEAVLKQTSLWKSEAPHEECVLTTNTFLREVLMAALALNSEYLRVGLSVVADDVQTYSALSVFNSYQVQLPDIFGAIRERVRGFRTLQAELVASGVGANVESEVGLAVIVQKHQSLPAIISYTFDQNSKAVYMEYGESLENLRAGQVRPKHVVMDLENLELSSLLVPKQYQEALWQVMHLHNEISEIFNVPVEVCWEIGESLHITSIRVVKENMKEFAP